MKAVLDLTECPASSQSRAMTFLIVYEDRATGCRARAFAEQLAEAGECDCDIAGLWRSDLLTLAPMAAEAAQEAARSEFIIVSLRGGIVPFAIRDWLEAHLLEAGVPGPALIALFEQAWDGGRAAEGARHYFHTLCSRRGVAFYAQVSGKTAELAVAGLREFEPLGGGLRAVPPWHFSKP